MSEPQTLEAISLQTSANTSLAHPSDEKPWLWKPGFCPNPSGRPANSITAHLQDALDSGEAKPLADRLIKIAKSGKDALAVQAIDMIQDRTEGKAVQQLRIQQDLDPAAMNALSRLADRLLGPEIEGEVVQHAQLEPRSGTGLP